MAKLPERYSKIKDEMKGDSSAAAALALKASGRYVKGGKPGVEVVNTTRPLRPGIIRWDGDEVSFLLKGMYPKGKRLTGQGLNLDTKLEKTWSKKGQGTDVKEFGYFGATADELQAADQLDKQADALKGVPGQEGTIKALRQHAANLRASEKTPPGKDRKKLLYVGAAAVAVAVIVAIKQGWILAT